MKHKWNKDCKSFPGSYACDILKAENYTDCGDCKYYEPYSKKILIIKLGAAGDVIRATTLLRALRDKYGKDLMIKWLVDDNNAEILNGNGFVDKVMVYNQDSVFRLQNEEFDILISLDADEPGTAIASLVNAKEKYGYYMDKYGHPASFNSEADYFLEMQFSDVLKKQNKKSSQQLMFEIACLPYQKQDYVLTLSEESKNYGEEFRKNNRLSNKKIMGLNMGSGLRWPNKSPSMEVVIELAKKIYESGNYQILLLGGPEEKKFYSELITKLKNENIDFVENKLDNSIRDFIGVVNLCDEVITTDSFAMHIALGLKKKVTALFYCTAPWEIEDYEYIKKITSDLLEKNFFNDMHNEELINSISADEILREV